MSDNDIRQMIADALRGGDSTGWFEQIYARADSGEGVIPWARNVPDLQLTRWLSEHQPQGRALVIGCGLGDDAEALADAGFEVTAFDIAETAIDLCKRRFPQTSVHYVVADLFALPAEWMGKFDFVLESRTIQALPWQYAEPAASAITAQIAPGGTLLVLCMGREPEEDRRGIPWALSRTELAHFLQYGLSEKAFTEYQEGGRRFCVEYHCA